MQNITSDTSSKTESTYIEIKPKKLPSWMNQKKPEPEPVSSPILHDIIKAYLVYEPKRMFDFCSALPQLRSSRIYHTDTPHHLEDARQEWFVDGISYPADAVWRFRSITKEYTYNGKTFPEHIGPFPPPSYYIIHEVKTGNYDLLHEMEKHYIHHNHVSFYVWAYKEYHKAQQKPPYSFVKLMPIESIRDYIAEQTTNLISRWVKA